MGHPIQIAAAQLGISPSTLRLWVKQDRAGLVARGRGRGGKNLYDVAGIAERHGVALGASAGTAEQLRLGALVPNLGPTICDLMTLIDDADLLSLLVDAPKNKRAAIVRLFKLRVLTHLSDYLGINCSK